MHGWLVVVATAIADANGAASLALDAGLVDGPDDCPYWQYHRVDSFIEEHTDLLSHPGNARSCAPRRTSERCMDWRVSVVRDHNGELLVDMEVDDPPMDDADIQALALNMRSSPEKATVLARWPTGSWNRVAACVDLQMVRPVLAPHRCAVLEPDGKPLPLAFGRGSENRCAVLIGGETGAEASAFPVPIGTDVEFDAGAFPILAEPGKLARAGYQLAPGHESLWHLSYVLVATEPKQRELESINERL